MLHTRHKGYRNMKEGGILQVRRPKIFMYVTQSMLQMVGATDDFILTSSTLE